MSDGRLGLSAPWVLFARDVEVLFAGDPDVEVTADAMPDGDGTYVVAIRVRGEDKAKAVCEVMPESVRFGDVDVLVNVIPASAEPTIEHALRRAFAGNESVRAIHAVGGTGTPRDGTTYVMFEPGVVQYAADDLSDYNGIRTTLLQDVAARVLDVGGAKVRFCTEPV